MSQRAKIFVVQQIPDNAVAALEELGEVRIHQSDEIIPPDAVAAGIRWADYLFNLGDTPINDAVLGPAPNLKGIAAMSIGPGGVDVDAASRHDIPVSCIPNIVVNTTADLTMALLLACAWRLPQADYFTRSGQFKQEQSMSFLCQGLDQQTLGIIGLGEIGRAVVERVRPYGMEILYTKRTRLDAADERALGVEWSASKEDVLRRADYLCLLARYNPTSHLIIGAPEFALLKPSAYFINTARGRLVDEPALVDVLRERRIAGAALDVYWNEPPHHLPAPSPELYRLDNVILTPHIGTATWTKRREMTLVPGRAIAAMIRGERPDHLLNPDVWDRRRR